MQHSAVLICLLATCGQVLADPRDSERLAIEHHEPLVLVAQSRLQHPAYRQTVVLVASLGRDEHVGLIVNRPTGIKLAEIFPQDVPSREVRTPVHFGGPMALNAVVAVSSGAQSPGGRSIPLGKALHLVFEEAIIDKVIRTKPHDARFFVGLVRWQPGELRAELRDNVWHLTATSPDRVLEGPSDRLWKDLVDKARTLAAHYQPYSASARTSRN